MIFLIKNAKDGSFIANVKSYEEALKIQSDKLKNENIDTYIENIEVGKRKSIEEIREEFKK